MLPLAKTGILKDKVSINDSGVFVFQNILSKCIYISQTHFISVQNADSVEMRRISFDSVNSIDGIVVAIQATNYSGSDLCYNNGITQNVLLIDGKTIVYQSISCNAQTRTRDMILTRVLGDSDSMTSIRGTNCSHCTSEGFITGHVVYLGSAGADNKFYNQIGCCVSSVKAVFYCDKSSGATGVRYAVAFANVIDCQYGFLISSYSVTSTFSDIVIVNFTGQLRSDTPGSIKCSNCYAGQPVMISGFTVVAVPITVVQEGKNQCPTFLFTTLRPPRNVRQLLVHFVLIKI